MTQLFFGPEGMDPEFRDYMCKVMEVQLSSENSIVRLFSSVKAPKAAFFRELAETAASEAMHSRGIAKSLVTLGVDPEPIIQSARFGKAEKMLEVLRDPKPENYDQVNILRWLSERAGGFQSIALFSCRYLPFAAWAAQNYIDEGEGHPDNAKEMLVPSIEGGRRESVQKTALEYYPMALDMFGATETKNEQKYMSLGIKNIPNKVLRAMWIRKTLSDFDEIGLDRPEDPYQGKRGRYDETRDLVEDTSNSLMPLAMTVADLAGKDQAYRDQLVDILRAEVIAGYRYLDLETGWKAIGDPDMFEDRLIERLRESKLVDDMVELLGALGEDTEAVYQQSLGPEPGDDPRLALYQDIPEEPLEFAVYHHLHNRFRAIRAIGAFGANFVPWAIFAFRQYFQHGLGDWPEMWRMDDIVRLQACDPAAVEAAFDRWVPVFAGALDPHPRDVEWQAAGLRDKDADVLRALFDSRIADDRAQASARKIAA